MSVRAFNKKLSFTTDVRTTLLCEFRWVIICVKNRIIREFDCTWCIWTSLWAVITTCHTVLCSSCFPMTLLFLWWYFSLWSPVILVIHSFALCVPSWILYSLPLPTENPYTWPRCYTSNPDVPHCTPRIRLLSGAVSWQSPSVQVRGLPAVLLLTLIIKTTCLWDHELKPGGPRRSKYSLPSGDSQSKIQEESCVIELPF